MNDGTFSYRLTFRPYSGRGTLLLVNECVIAGEVVYAHEFEAVFGIAQKMAYELLGAESGALKVSRVERLESSGEWRDRRWPIPTSRVCIFDAATVAPLCNHIPTWPA